MKNSNNLWRLVLLLAATGAAAVLARGYVFILNDKTGLPIKWMEGPVNLRLMLGADKTLSDGSTYNGAAQAAANLWNAEIGGVQFQVTTGTGTATENNDTNELVFASKVFDRDFGADVAAVTTVWHAGNRRGEGDIVFNTAWTWDSYRGPMKNNRTVDLRRVAIHELGHVLGLDHPDEAGQQQNAIMNSYLKDLDTLAADDIGGAQQLYGPTTAPINDNYAQASTFPAATTSGNQQFGAVYFNTKGTKEPGEPNHADNAGGRSVWWRWKAPTYGTMTIDTKGSLNDTTLAVYTGTSVSSLTVVASNDDIEQGVVQASKVTFQVIGNATYMIAVDGFNNNDGKGATSSYIKVNCDFSPAAGEGPVITTQPSSTTVDVGGNASFSVAATGAAPLSFQWRLNGTAISGATNSSYSISNVQSAHEGTYTVTVTNTVGSTISENASLTVRTPAPAPAPAPTPPSSGGGGGGGGGGGAPSSWFVAALAALGLGRFLQRRRR